MLKKYILGISLLVVCMFTLSVAATPVLTNSADADVLLLNEPDVGLLGPRSIAWEATITFTNGVVISSDYVFMGEAPESGNGPPADIHDSIKSPAPPAPYVYAYFNDNLGAAPYNKLTGDYRHYCDGVDKQWNLTIMHDFGLDYPNSVDFTWSSSDFATSPYGNVYLRDNGGTIVADMLAVETYSEPVTAIGTLAYTITCENAVCPVDGENCFNPYELFDIPVDLDFTHSADTTGLVDNYAPTGEDAVYMFDVTAESMIDVILDNVPAGAFVGIYDDCPDVGTLLVSANTKDGKATTSIEDYTIAPGTYYLAVDGGSFTYDLTIHYCHDVGVSNINTFTNGQELNANVTYPVQVEVCNYGNDEASIPVHVVIEGGTAKAATTVMPVEGFDGYVPPVPPTFPPTGWSLVQPPCSPTNDITHNTDQAYTGAGSCRFSSYTSCGSGYDEYLVSEPLTTASGDQTVSLWYLKYSSGSEVFSVGWSTTGNDVNTDFTWSSDITDASTTWQQFTKTDLPVGTTYVAIHYKSNYQYYLYVDDIALPGSVNEGFEGTPASGFPPAGWTHEVVSGTDTDNYWKISDSTAITPISSPYMVEYDVLIISTGNSARLYTPELDFSINVDHELKFWMYHDDDYDTYDDKVVIQVSTDGSSWTNITEFTTYDPVEGWDEKIVDLGAYDGQSSVWIGFLGVSDYGYNNVYIDDVEVVADDGAPGGVVYDDTVTIPLNAGDCTDVDLDDWYAEPGNYTITACTELPTDDNNGNNCTSIDVVVLPGIHDVGVTEITSPPAHIYVGDPYTVEATVCNFGDFDEPTIPVHADIYWKNLTAGDDDDDDDATSGVLFQEDFETGFPGNMTWNDYNPGEGDWYWMTYGDYYSECEPQSGLKYVCGDAWGYPSPGSSAAYDDGLETPQVDCSLCEQVFVNYSNRNFLADTEAHIRVYEDGVLLGSVPAGLTQEQQSTDISSLAANKDKISVEMYYDDVYNGGFWMFDNVVIYGVDTTVKDSLETKDKAVEWVLVYTADATISLLEGECDTVSFSPDFTPTIPGEYMINVTTELLNDWVPENDSATAFTEAFIPNVLNVGTGLWYTTIQEAVDAASPGDILQAVESPIPDGVYNENVVVDKEVTIMPYDAMPTLNADGGTGFNVIADNVVIYEFNIIDGLYGVLIDGVNGVTVRNATIENNTEGIRLFGATGYSVIYNTFCFNEISIANYEGLILKSSGKDSLLSEGFEGTGLPTGWISIDDDGDGYEWDCDWTYPYSGSESAGSASYINDVGALNPDNYLVTSQIDLTAYINAELNFYSAAQDPDWPDEYLEVMVSTTGTNPGDFTSVFSFTETDDTWKLRTVDLSPYDGMPIYIAFRHCNSYDNYWIKIDDVEVTADPFGADYYTLDVNIIGNGIVNLDPDLPEYIEGTMVELDPIADPGWVFDHWEGDLTGSDDPVMLTMDSNKVVTAVFVLDLSGEVGIHYNYFGCMDECETPGVAIHNFDENVILDARWNWYSAVDGPSGGTIDANTGRVANGFGFSVFGCVNFDPWWGIDAVADISEVNVLVGDSITFDAFDSFGFGYDLDNLVLSYLWDFDNMDYSMEEEISYSYDEPGIYKGYLRVSAIDLDLSDFAMYDWDYFTIVVSEPGQALGANADGNDLGEYEGTIGEPVTFYGIATGGVPGYTFKWEINGHTLTGQTVEYSFNAPGTYTIELTVTDSEFNTATDTASVYIAEIDELVAKAGGPYDSTASEPVYLAGSASGGKAPYTYTWNFGDGSSPVTAQNPLHVYETEGTYTITLRVTDSVGTVDEGTTTVTVSKAQAQPEIVNVKGGLSLKATVISTDLPVDWTITVDGKFVFGRTTATGTVAANTEETIRAPFVFGLGNVDITITANEVVSQHTAFMIGPFVLSLN
jgi:hypothetical protein